MRKLALLLGIPVLAALIWTIVASVEAGPVPVGMDLEIEDVDPAPLTATEEGASEEAGSERSEVEATVLPATENARFVQVLVTNKESGEPVPGAKVAWYESFSTRDLTPEEAEEYVRIRQDPEQVAHRYGTTVLADARGEVVIPVERYVTATGRQGQWYGELYIRPDPEEEEDVEYRLELERDSFLVVQVLDSLGRPAVGVPIGIFPEWGDERDHYGRLPLAVSEAPDGFANIPHLQLKLRSWERRTPAPARYFVRAMIPGLTGKGERTDPRNPPDAPLIVRLPPIGRVVVRVTDPGGKLLAPELVRSGVSLFIQPEAHPSGERIRSPGNEQWHSSLAEDGTHVFDRVVAGKTYVARAHPPGDDVEGAFEGPLAEGQEVVATLSLEGELFFLVGRAIDRKRQPLRNAPMSLSFSLQGGSSGSRWVFQTDDRGYFRVAVPVRAPLREVTLQRFTIEEDRSRAPSGTAGEGPIAMYSWVGDMSFVAGDNDIGDVMLDAGALVGSGQIRVNGETPTRTRFNLQLQGMQIVGTRTSTRQRWVGEEGVKVSYLEEGRFEIHGVPESNRYRITARDPTYLPLNPIEFVPGAEDLEIDLETGGSLSAEVVGDEGVPLQGLQLRLIPTEGQDQMSQDPDDVRAMRSFFGERTLAQVVGQEGGRFEFRWRSLWAGGYRLEVGPRGGRPLLEVPGIHIQGGEQNEDPRLNEIDLRGKVRQVTVRLRDQDGGPIPDVEYGQGIVLVTSADGEMHGFRAQGGSAAILTGEPFLDLLVAAQGYKPERLPAVVSDTTVNLERFPDVIVRIAGGLPVLPDKHDLRVTVSEMGREIDPRRYTEEYQAGERLDQWLRPPMSRRTVDEDGEVRVQVRGAGEYRVRVRVQSAETRRSGTIPDTQPPTVHLTGSGSEVIEIQIPEEGLRQAMEQAGRR